ncbi:hypothetical protein [Streptomyces mirabilis]|uniref:Uncharacterized protein n=1 Tax=Streptomyces mirabilis TaxID=68239 RepID=A0ABU3V5S5_9ACTN|nr:hypothetical protein [Streptomyces mirabilis]MCX5355880.1 hypothetical protein [Streptomyces mirabilis]MDU9001522.1 hypothetical protein [Streptomyces mirabilis]
MNKHTEDALPTTPAGNPNPAGVSDLYEDEIPLTDNGFLKIGPPRPITHKEGD